MSWSTQEILDIQYCSRTTLLCKYNTRALSSIYPQHVYTITVRAGDVLAQQCCSRFNGSQQQPLCVISSSALRSQHQVNSSQLPSQLGTLANFFKYFKLWCKPWCNTEVHWAVLHVQHYHCKLFTWVQTLHACIQAISLASQRVKGYHENAHGIAAK